jgi:nucleotide-binding universal stress UspA family protein
MFKRILVATDGSKLSKKAVASAIALAAQNDADLVALNVIPRYPRSYFEGSMTFSPEDIGRVEKQWADKAQAMLDTVSARAKQSGVRIRTAIVNSDRGSEEAPDRPDRDGIARPQGHQAPAAGQRDAARADALGAARSRASVGRIGSSTSSDSNPALALAAHFCRRLTRPCPRARASACGGGSLLVAIQCFFMQQKLYFYY